MKTTSIYQKEEDLFNELRKSYTKNISKKIVDDGLCWADISSAVPVKEKQFWPENLWEDADRKILFLLKEANGNGGEDYKDWYWSKGHEGFGNVLAYWLEGIHSTTKQYCPNHYDMSLKISRAEILKKYPFAIVNVKKIAGDNKADWKEIWEHAAKNKDFLKKQIRDILKPNIIICGGSNDSNNGYKKMITIAKEIIFDDEKEEFIKINNWCHYNPKIDVLLIDSYHPAMPGSYSSKIDDLLINFQHFILNTNYSK